MNYINLQGTTWVNEFGSVLKVQTVDPSTGIFYGTYQSDTGATGIYHVTGITDTSPDPTVNSQTISFSISWRSFQGSNDDTQYWVGAFSGQIQLDPYGIPLMPTTFFLQHNTNPADNWGATIVSTATYKPQSSSKSKKRVSAMPKPKVPSITDGGGVGSITFPLTKGALSDNGATPWTSPVGVGTGAQTLNFMIDTGTDNTWATSAQCTTPACQVHNSFDASKSSTYVVIDSTPQDKSFGPWGTMTVVIGQDNWTLPEGIEQTLNFEVSINYSGKQFTDLDADGGIAIPGPFWNHTDSNTQSMLVELLKSGKIGYPAVSFWTDPANGVGACIFGAVDTSKYNPATLQWIPLQNDYDSPLNYLWQIPLNELSFDGAATSAQITAFVLDTGSSYFKGPQDLIQTLQYEATRNGTLPTFVTNEADLAKYPTMTLNIGSYSYELTPEQYFLQTGVSYWEIGIQVLDGMPEGMLLVGSVFLDTVYSIFDLQYRYIGLANLT